MYVLITYDVQTSSEDGCKRLRKVAKCCLNHGQRVQNSVFECLLSEADLILLRAELIKLIDKETDSIRIYRLGNNYKTKIEHLGKETSFDLDGLLTI